MKKTTYAVTFLFICMLLSACKKEGGVGGAVDNPEIEERIETGKETSAEEKVESRKEKAAVKPDEKSKEGEEESIEGEEESKEGEEAEEWETKWVKTESPACIPETLLKFLGDLAGKENDEVIENITPLISDCRLEEEELEEYKDDPAAAECIERMEESKDLLFGGGILLRVDGDNDGIEDLFAWFSDGGSMGANYRVFLKGQRDGGFVRTDSWEDITQELIFIEFEGKNYLLETTYDYYKKFTDGFLVSCFEEGVCCERIYIRLTDDGYKADINLTDRSYKELADKIAEMRDAGFKKDYDYDWLFDIGSGEVKDDAPEGLEDARRGAYYRSDINNDGKEEWYKKSIFYPSTLYTNMYLVDSLYLNGDSEGEELVTYYGLECEGVPLAFWVEHVEKTDKQIVCLLCYDGLSRYIVYGILIEGEKAEEIMEIDFRGNEKVEYEIEILREVS